MAPVDGLHQGGGLFEGIIEVFLAERRLPGTFDRGEETLFATDAVGASVLLYRDCVEEENLGKPGFLPG
jgi:hypothetical protein